MSGCRLAWSVSFVFTWLWVSAAGATEYTFDPGMLDGAAKGVDLTLFEEGAQMPGTYPVQIIVGDTVVDQRNVDFHVETDAAGKPTLQPCLTVEQLSRYGIKTENYPGLSQGAKGDGEAGTTCANIHAIPQGGTDFHFFSQQLVINVPQIALRPHFEGVAPEVMWDDGITAFLMSYQASVNRTENTSGGEDRNDTGYLQLTPGLNLGPWRLRNLITWQRYGHQKGEWQRAYSYVDRGINRWKSRLTLGESSTPSDVFDSVPFRGAMVSTDESMLPGSLRDFAPAVRGIARSAAQIEIRQNGYLLYSKHVAAGPFAITDLPRLIGGGNLQVTVIESEGPSQTFVVPYTEPPVALRAGYLKYSVMAGQYRPDSETTDGEETGQVTAMYGFPLNITGYGGVQGGEHYQAATVGVGFMMGILGAVSLDVTRSHGRFKAGQTQGGQVVRMRYSKSVESTGANINLSGEWYGSGRYHTLSEVMDSWQEHGSSPSSYPDNGMSGWDEPSYQTGSPRRYMTSAQISQPFGDWGSLYLSGARTTCQNGKHDDDLSAGYTYSIAWHQVSLSLNVNHTRSTRHSEQMMSLSVNIPLSRWFGGSPGVNYQVLSARHGQVTHTLGLSGNGFDDRLNWGVSQRIYTGGETHQDGTSDVNLRWDGGYGEIQGSYGYSHSQRNMSAGVSGGVVIHRHGITLSQSLGDTIGLVEAPGASGVSVGYMPGVSTDFRGYTTENFLSPYQINTINLDVATLPGDAEVNQTDVQVVPTQGAVILAHFDTHIGARALIQLVRPGGGSVPFGAMVSLMGDDRSGSGIAGDDGTVYLSGLPEKGVLQASLGKTTCYAHYRLPDKPGGGSVFRLTARCDHDTTTVTGGER
ncbi:pilin outer membrane usher protein SafC [Klebsiella quasipneumoniae subsp. similipneumoniae]|uniref:fimbria/pilus outer membrane usher protein n=1 Tax=Klebsiella quasipneumoniae TaxID=1463165 RepID=UPI000F08575C|nr:fimbria/pilus outer membrane usher protein [Klebsiella quasipneumoniae]RND22706.1 pilin outer membrane usher protein SafC [Klebsiella quasipneumoniae subsp. similipneumoniae]